MSSSRYYVIIITTVAGILYPNNFFRYTVDILTSVLHGYKIYIYKYIKKKKKKKKKTKK